MAEPDPPAQPLDDPGDESARPIQGELFSASDLISLEKARVESYDRRTEVARAAIEASNESDKRQFDFHMTKLQVEAEADARKHKSFVKLAWALFGGIFVPIVFLVAMAFFGDEAQRQTAVTFLRTMGTGTGGFGIGWILLMLFRRLR